MLPFCCQGGEWKIKDGKMKTINFLCANRPSKIVWGYNGNIRITSNDDLM